MPLVCGVRGLVWRHSAPSPAQARAKAGVRAAAVVGQHVGELERERRRGLAEKGDGAPFRLVVLDGQVDGARPAVDGDEQAAFAPLAISCLQLGQALDVDVHEAEVVVPEGALSLGGPVGRRLGPAVQSLAPQDAKDAVAVDVW